MKREWLCLFSAPVLQALPQELFEHGSSGTGPGTDRTGLMCDVCMEISGVQVDNTVP